MEGVDPKPALVFVIGSPGSGKGTLCKKWAAEHGLHHISIGDFMRQVINSTDVDAEILATVKGHGALPPQVLFSLLQPVIEKFGADKLVILDGFPRKLEQAEPFVAAYGSPLAVLHFACPKETAEARLVSRNVGREDDTREKFRERHKDFADLSPAIIKHFEDFLITVDTGGSREDSYAKLVDATRTKISRVEA